MADKPIGDLTAATAVTAGDLFVLQQNNTAKKLTAQILENWLVALADGHGGIQSIVKTSSSGLVDTYTITLSDETTTAITVTNGKAISSVTTYYAVSSDGSTAPSSWSTTRQSMTATNRYLWSYQTIAFNDNSTVDTVKTVIGVWGDKGDTGAAGRGIEDLEQTSRVPGSYTLYTFTMSDGTTETFYSYDGVGISGIEKTSTSDLVDTYTISFTNNTTTTFTVTNAKSITDIAKTSTSGLEDTYTISMNDGTTTTFTVTNAKSIVSITKDSSVGLVDTYTILYNDGTTTEFTVSNGKSISSISKTSSSGLVDTYTVSFNDGTTTTFTVTNGSSIATIAKSSTVGLVDTYTVTLTNGATSTFTVKNAKSIVSVAMVSGTHAAGTTDTYRITFNDGDTTNFTVYNGTNGTGSVSTVDGIPSNNQNVTLLLTGNGPPTQSTVGQLKQRYFDLSNQILYICTGIDTSSTPATYSWAGTGVPVDSSLSSSSENPVQNKVITAKVGTEALTTTATNLSGAVNELDDGKLSTSGDGSNVTAAFTAASSRTNIATGEKLSVIFGKIAKWLTDLGTAAFRAATSTISSGSTDLVESGAVHTALSGKQDTLTFDNTPTQNSNNPVKSGGVYTALASKAGSDLGITGASVGDLVRISAVSNGKPTAFTKVPLNAIICNRNLLDNWYFVGGGSQQGGGQFPINQRGQTSYSNAGYTIDRWKNDSSLMPVAVNSSCITLSQQNSAPHTFYQVLPPDSIPDGTQYTISILSNYGLSSVSAVAPTNAVINIKSQAQTILYTVFYQRSSNSFRIYNTNTEPLQIYAVKLELGPEQTLAHQKNGAWVLNEIPDYGQELAKCQRYLYVIPKSTSGYAPIGDGITYSETNGYVTIHAPVNFCKQPTITATGNYSIIGNGTLKTATLGGLYAWCGNVVAIRFTGADFPVNHSVMLAKNNSPNAEIYISADL